ncbi:hypothetical protein pb186bvf_014035 [Paramecium bursaria]
MKNTKSQKMFRVIMKSSLSPKFTKQDSPHLNRTIQSRKSSDVLKLLVSPKISHRKPNFNSFDDLSKSRRQILKQDEQDLESEEDSIQIIVTVLGQELKFNIKYTSTTTQLRQYLIKKIKMPQRIVQFMTNDRNFIYDYYLSLDERSLSMFKDKILDLHPSVFDKQDADNVNIKDFTLVRCIGSGGFSRVYLVRYKVNGKFYAMKLIDKEFVLQNKKQDLIQNERDIMSVIKHPFTVKMEYAFESKNYIIFIMEFCSGGELFYQLKQVRRMTEEQALFYFTEICLGMLYLHQVGIIYRDIKPENILVDIDGHIRIADFGLSKIQTEDEYAYSFCGSPEYMAPEMLLKTGHNYQVDHYCLGALLYELVTGLPPFYSRNTQKIYDSILNENITFPQYLSTEIKDLMGGLLSKHPSKRLGGKGGLNEIIQHPWFKSINFLDVINKKIDPPLKPQELQLNFDIKNLNQIDSETRDKLQGKTGMKKEIKMFTEFYFDSNQNPAIKEIDRLYKEHEEFVKNLSTRRQFHKNKSLDRLIKTEDSRVVTSLKKRIEQQTALTNNSIRGSPKNINYTRTDFFMKTESSLEKTFQKKK